MIDIKLSIGHFKEILNKGYSLDMVYLLLLSKEIDISELALEMPKIDVIHSSLIRKGLLSEGKVTKDGEELLKFLSTSDNVKIKKTIVKQDDFDLFWKTYPGTDTFEYKGKKFTGTRSLRVKKDDCKDKLKKIINENEYTINDIIEALKLEVQQKVEASYKTGQNKVSFMQNSLTWLNQRSFEPFIELVKAGHTSEEETRYTKGVDI